MNQESSKTTSSPQAISGAQVHSLRTAQTRTADQDVVQNSKETRLPPGEADLGSGFLHAEVSGPVHGGVAG
ncbi:unnamed protein product [Arctogadus glacialis]